MLLIDEIDRADDEFEAYLLEVLSDWQITVPELGAFRPTSPPLVVLTSNRTRDVHDALKRRCLYHWVEHPTFEREVAIVRLRLPEVGAISPARSPERSRRCASCNLYKPPGVAETIDWATALGRLGVEQLDEQAVEATLGTVLKYREDHERVEQHGSPTSSSRPSTRIADDATALTSGSWSPRPDPPRRGGSRSPSAGCCAASGSACRSARCVSFAEALGIVGLDSRDDVYWAARATLVRRPEDLEPFDRAFAVFFDGADATARPTTSRSRWPSRWPSTPTTTTGPTTAQAADETVVQLRFSVAEVLRHRISPTTTTTSSPRRTG